MIYMSKLSQWAIDRIEAGYKDDVCLLIEHNALKLERDRNSKSFSFYIPATSRASGLAKTFIIDGIGHDLFPMPWERIEQMADVKDYNTTCLAHGEILWARSEEDKQRFISLQERLHANLKNPQYMQERAKTWLNTVNEIYQDTLFEDRLYKIRENAGYICDLLSIAVAFVNGRYFPHGQAGQIQELSTMDKVPANFSKLYQQIVFEESPDVQKRLCYEIIKSVKIFIDSLSPEDKAGVPDFSELASWYQELSYTWLRVYHCCDAGDAVSAYVWCCMLQNEVEEWGTRFGIKDIDILSSYKASDLTSFKKRAEFVESKFRQAIEENGTIIEEYNSIDDFLAANPAKR